MMQSNSIAASLVLLLSLSPSYSLPHSLTFTSALTHTVCQKTSLVCCCGRHIRRRNFHMGSRQHNKPTLITTLASACLTEAHTHTHAHKHSLTHRHKKAASLTLLSREEGEE